MQTGFFWVLCGAECFFFTIILCSTSNILKIAPRYAHSVIQVSHYVTDATAASSVAAVRSTERSHRPFAKTPFPGSAGNGERAVTGGEGPCPVIAQHPPGCEINDFIFFAGMEARAPPHGPLPLNLAPWFPNGFEPAPEAPSRTVRIFCRSIRIAEEIAAKGGCSHPHSLDCCVWLMSPYRGPLNVLIQTKQPERKGALELNAAKRKATFLTPGHGMAFVGCCLLPKDRWGSVG